MKEKKRFITQLDHPGSNVFSFSGTFDRMEKVKGTDGKDYDRLYIKQSHNGKEGQRTNVFSFDLCETPVECITHHIGKDPEKLEGAHISVTGYLIVVGESNTKARVTNVCAILIPAETEV